MIESVDTVWLVQPVTRPPTYAELWKLGFKPTNRNEEGQVHWYFNAPQHEHRPNITLVQNRKSGYGLWVCGSLPNIHNGENATLLDQEEINTTLYNISDYVSNAYGSDFDAHRAFVARLDLATNFLFKNAIANEFLNRYRRLYIPNMPLIESLDYPGSVYRGNNSRTYVAYDKSREMGCPNADWTRIRVESRLPNRDGVDAYRKRHGFKDRRANTMLSPEALSIGFDKMFNDLQLDTFDPEADHTFDYFFKATGGHFAQARKSSSFVAIYKYLGPDFYLLPNIKMTKQTYIRELRECQQLGF